MNDKNFEKVKIKFEITIQECTLVPSLSQFGKLQFLRLNLPKKDFKVQYQDKLNLKITYFK